MKSWIFAAVLLASSCASIRELIDGNKVTKERCEQLNLQEFGFKDGETGQRRYERIEFWQKDCRQLGVNFDRSVYDKGYEDGLQIYCSCEKGFATGVRDEFVELKGQYQMCSGKTYRIFAKANDWGKKYSKDQSLMRQEGPHKLVYFDGIIENKAKEVCPEIVKAVEAEPTPTPGPKTK